MVNVLSSLFPNPVATEAQLLMETAAQGRNTKRGGKKGLSEDPEILCGLGLGDLLAMW